MKKILSLLMVLAIAVPLLRAQNPDAIYIGTWDAMMASKGDNYVGSPITPNPSDPKLTYDESTGCYEGNIYNWPRMAGMDLMYDKIPYSYDGNEVTYYSGASYGVFYFSKTPSYTSSITITTNPASVKGYYINTQNGEAVEAAHVSLNISTKQITFTRIENVAVEAPKLENINPANHSTVTPESDGSVKIVLTFSSEVSTLSALVDGTDINAKERTVNKDGEEVKEPTGWDNNISSSEGGTVWTLIVPAELISAGTSEDGGSLNLKIEKVTGNGVPVTFDDGNNILLLSYNVKGISKTATLNITGNDDNVLTVYSSIAIEEEDVQYIEGAGTLKIDGNSYEFPISTVQRFLFTVPEGYDVAVTSSLAQSASNWQSGNAWTETKVVDPDDDSDNPALIFNKVMEGTYINVYPGAIGSGFNVAVTKSDASGKYLSGQFNNNNPNGDASYELKQDTDMENDEDIVNQYIVYYEIPANQFAFNIKDGNKVLVPALGKSTAVTFTQDAYKMVATMPYAVGLASDESNNVNYWTNSSWTDATEVAIMVDTDAKTITFQYDAPVDDTVWWIRGAFNNYNPGKGAEWALYEQKEFDGDDQEGMYVGQFNIPAGQLSFNLVDPTNQIFCPYDEQGYEGEAKTITFVNGSYSTNFGLAYPEYGENDIYCSDPTWKGGELVFIIDGNTGNVEVSLPKVYLSGDFNEYLPKGGFSTWQLVPSDDDDNICVGYFDIPEGDFNMNFKYGLSSYFIPAAGQALTFTDNVATTTFKEEGDGTAMWTCSGFAGGKVKVTLNQTDKTISFEVVNPYINVSGGESIELNPSSEDDANGIFIAYVPVSDSSFTFNIEYGTTYYIPTAATATSSKPLAVTLTDNEYTGKYKAGAENIFWQVNDLSEGELYVEFNTNASSISLQFIPKEAEVLYIRGAFNDYDPQNDEKWALTPAEEDDENGVYTGKFTAAQGEMSFNLIAPTGIVFIPASLVSENIIFEASDEGGVVFEGNMDYAEEGQENIYWTCSDWAGGEFTVTINADEGTITITASEESTIVNALNKFTEDDAIYNLQGVKVSNPVKGGIYIINGKKVLVK